MSVHVRYFRKDKFIKMFDESDQSDLLSNVAGGSFEFPNDHVRLHYRLDKLSMHSCENCCLVSDSNFHYITDNNNIQLVTVLTVNRNTCICC